MSSVVLVCVVGCGGADATLDLDSGNGNDSAQPNDSGNPPVDGGSDVTQQVSCDGGLTACGGQCVDTASDDKNCGGCGIVCNTQCAAGVCPLIAAGCDGGVAQQASDNACLTVDAKNVYWGTGFNNTGSVWSVPLGGGCPTLMIGGQAAPHGMASDGTNLFYANQGTFQANNGSIQRIPVGGGSATPIATNQAFPLDVAVDANNVYWTNSADGSVWKSDKTTPNPVKLAGPLGLNHARFLRVDATNVYFTDGTSGVVDRVPIAGGSVAPLSTAVTNAGHLAIDTKNAYFASRGATTAALMSVPLNASAATPSQLVPNLPSLNGIETDGTSIWFAEATNVQPYAPSTGEIHRVTAAGASDTKLASGQNGPDCVSVDATSVYWIDTGGGMISKTGK
ncbi:MAG TPA: hypothetical protein VGH28_26610 [Polyangiaceae bacterium]|jgi:hypothetical protein